MKLFRISQTQNDDYDTFDSAIVCAESEDDARTIHPGLGKFECYQDSLTWCDSPEHVTVEYIGEAREDMERGVVLASFNYG